MFTTKTYKGILNGSYCISCGHIEEGMEVEEEITVYHPDAGKVFVKNDEEFTAVVLQDGEDIEDYEEVEKPEEESRV